MAVEFIGANAEELTRRALGGDDANGDDAGLEAHAVWSSDREAEALASALPSTPTRNRVPSRNSRLKRRSRLRRPTATSRSRRTRLERGAGGGVGEGRGAPSPARPRRPPRSRRTWRTRGRPRADAAAAEAAAAIAAERNDRDDDEEAFSAQTDAAFAEAERVGHRRGVGRGRPDGARRAARGRRAPRDAGAPGGGSCEESRVGIDPSAGACYEEKNGRATSSLFAKRDSAFVNSLSRTRCHVFRSLLLSFYPSRRRFRCAHATPPVALLDGAVRRCSRATCPRAPPRPAACRAERAAARQ